MHHVNTVRKAALAVAALSATLAVTACQSSDSASGTGGSSPTPSASASASSSPSPASSAPSSAPSAPPATASPASHSSSGSGSGAGAGSGTAVKTCAATALNVTAHQAANPPVGTGTGAAVFEFTNTSKQTCVLQGHPTVAGAGNGSPQHNAPLKVTPTGTATQVKLAPGGKAWLKLTFVQVQGEADGYCKSGATPTTYPTMVIGLPGAGSHQVALDDGVFAECDNTVTATAVSGAALS